MRNLCFFIAFLSFFCTRVRAQKNTMLGKQTFELQISQKVYYTSDSTEIAAEAGTLTVKENRDKPGSAGIQLPFIRLKSTAANPLPPVVYLEGGPGSSCTWMAERPWALDQWEPLLALGDVILLDQRGTGAAGQRLTYIHTGPLPENLLVDAETATNHMVSLVAPAKKAWAKAGVDYRGYTTLASAQDIDDLRRALSLEKVSVFGFSYGTQLAQAYMKYFGDYVEKAVLVGVEGLGETYKLPLRMDAQFRKLAALVKADPAIRQDVPDLVKLYKNVAGKLTRNPITITLSSPLTGEDMEVKVGKFGLDYILFVDLGDASDLPVIPRLLYDIDHGNYESFRWFLQKRIGGSYGLHAMALTTDLASGVSPAREALILEQTETSMFGSVINGPLLALRDALNGPDLGPEYRADFTSTIPTLLLSGSLDMNTPPYQAERLRWNLANATHIIVGNAGHEQTLRHPAIGPAIGKFLAGGDVSDVTANYPSLKFIPVSGEREGVGHPAVGSR